MIKIRLATREDLPSVLEIEQENMSPPWTYGSLLDELNKDDSYFIVAAGGMQEHRPRIVGFAILRQVGDDWELLQIAVDKVARRSGIGDKLMAAVLEHADEHALGSVFLEVRSGNTAAVMLYEKHGFETVRVRKDYYDSPIEDAVVMMKILKSEECS